MCGVPPYSDAPSVFFELLHIDLEKYYILRQYP